MIRIKALPIVALAALLVASSLPTVRADPPPPQETPVPPVDQSIQALLDALVSQGVKLPAECQSYAPNRVGWLQNCLNVIEAATGMAMCDPTTGPGFPNNIGGSWPTNCIPPPPPRLPYAFGDGFVATYSVHLPPPADPAPNLLPVVPTLDGISLQVSPVDGATAYVGGLTLFIQVDCGALTGTVPNPPCMTGSQAVHTAHLDAPNHGGVYDFALSAADLAGAFNLALPVPQPVSAVHVWVQDDSGRASSYNVAINALAASDPALADQLEADGGGAGVFFTPLVLVNAAALPVPLPPSCVPAVPPAGDFPAACLADLQGLLVSTVCGASDPTGTAVSTLCGIVNDPTGLVPPACNPANAGVSPTDCLAAIQALLNSKVCPGTPSDPAVCPITVPSVLPPQCDPSAVGAGPADCAAALQTLLVSTVCSASDPTATAVSTLCGIVNDPTAPVPAACSPSTLGPDSAADCLAAVQALLSSKVCPGTSSDPPVCPITVPSVLPPPCVPAVPPSSDFPADCGAALQALAVSTVCSAPDPTGTAVSTLCGLLNGPIPPPLPCGPGDVPANVPGCLPLPLGVPPACLPTGAGFPLGCVAFLQGTVGPVACGVVGMEPSGQVSPIVCAILAGDVPDPTGLLPPGVPPAACDPTGAGFSPTACASALTGLKVPPDCHAGTPADDVACAILGLAGGLPAACTPDPAGAPAVLDPAACLAALGIDPTTLLPPGGVPAACTLDPAAAPAVLDPAACAAALQGLVGPVACGLPDPTATVVPAVCGLLAGGVPDLPPDCSADPTGTLCGALGALPASCDASGEGFDPAACASALQSLLVPIACAASPSDPTGVVLPALCDALGSLPSPADLLPPGVPPAACDPTGAAFDVATCGSLLQALLRDTVCSLAPLDPTPVGVLPALCDALGGVPDLGSVLPAGVPPAACVAVGPAFDAPTCASDVLAIVGPPACGVVSNEPSGMLSPIVCGLLADPTGTLCAAGVAPACPPPTSTSTSTTESPTTTAPPPDCALPPDDGFDPSACIGCDPTAAADPGFDPGSCPPPLPVDPAALLAACTPSASFDPFGCLAVPQGIVGPVLCGPLLDLPVAGQVLCGLLGLHQLPSACDARVPGFGPAACLKALGLPDPTSAANAGPACPNPLPDAPFVGQPPWALSTSPVCPVIVMSDPASTTLTEGAGEGAATTVRVHLKGPTPSAPVAVTLEGRDDLLVSPNRLVFTPSNFGDDRTVRVTYLSNPVAEGTRDATVVATASQGGYDVAAPVTATLHLVDPVKAAVLVDAADPMVVTVGQEPGTIHVSLASKPTSNVLVLLHPGPRVGVSPDALLFRPADYGAQDVAVHGIDDGTVGAVRDHITFTVGAQGEQSGYQDVEVTPVTLLVQQPAHGFSGGGSGGASSGSGGGSSATTTTTAAPASSTSSSAPASVPPAPAPQPSVPPAAPPPASTPAPAPSVAVPSSQVADANKALAGSLAVTHQGSYDVLTWSAVPGASGYQVFSHHSPFTLLGNVGQSTLSFRHSHVDGTRYVVTAVFGNQTLTAKDLDNGNVPGYTSPPAGTAADSGKGAPALGPAALLAALVALVLAARRRLP